MVRQQRQSDVVIVDAAAPDAVARLATAGFDVVGLQQSDWTDPADYMSDRPETEPAWIEHCSPIPTPAGGQPTIR